MHRNARQWRNPMKRRRIALVLIGIAALLAFIADRWLEAWVLIPVVALSVAGGMIEARVSDGLLTYRFPGTKRRSLTLIGVGLVVVVAATFLHALPPHGLTAALLVGGLGLVLGGGGALAWHHGATYAGGKIERLSEEEW